MSSHAPKRLDILLELGDELPLKVMFEAFNEVHQVIMSANK